MPKLNSRWSDNLSRIAKHALRVEQASLSATYPYNPVTVNEDQASEHQKTNIPPWMPIVFRLDGVAFRTFTKRFSKPFDDRLTQSMIRTTEDLVIKLNARLGYTISDEILLILPPACTIEAALHHYKSIESITDPEGIACRELIDRPLKEGKPERSQLELHPHPYQGRLFKLISLSAAYASVRFNHHLNEMMTQAEDRKEEAQENQEQQSKVTKYTKQPIKRPAEALFDSRCYGLQDPRDAISLLLWRQKFDGYRNAVNAIGQHYLGHKRIQHLDRGAVVQLLKDKLQLDIHHDSRIDASNLFGTFVKRAIVSVEGENVKTGERITTERSHAQSRSFDWNEKNDERSCELIYSKYWPRIK